MTSPVRAPRRRARGLLLAVLLVAAQASGWLHAAVVAHVTCLEHGESIHAGASGHLDADHQNATGDGAAQLSGAEVAAGEHDHCGVGALLRWRDVAISAPPAAASLVSYPASAARVASATGRQSAVVYLLAPKTSPPAPVV